MKKNDEFIIDITDVTNEGSGVGKCDGMAVFVPLTAVGDKIKAKAIKVKKNYAIGKVMEIIEPSADRIDNDCEAFRSCGGCVFRHISYGAEDLLPSSLRSGNIPYFGSTPVFFPYPHPAYHTAFVERQSTAMVAANNANE